MAVKAQQHVPMSVLRYIAIVVTISAFVQSLQLVFQALGII